MTLAANMASLHGGGGARIRENFCRWLAEQTNERWLLAVPRGTRRTPAATDRLRWLESTTGRSAWLTRPWFDNVALPRAMRSAGCRGLLSLTNHSTMRPRVPHVLLFHHAFHVYPDSPLFARLDPRERARHRA